MILAPGVIQLTLLNATALDRIIRDLARDPRYSSILHLRTGVDTRSSGGYSSTVTQLLGRDPSAQGPPAQASSSQVMNLDPPTLLHSLCFQAVQKWIG